MKFLLVSHWLGSGENFASILLVSHWHFTGKPYSRNNRKTVAKLSVQNWKTREFDHLTPSWAYTWKRSQKHPENMFSHKNNLKNFEKHEWYKSLPKANKKNKNLFGLIHIWLRIHTSHLNMYNHSNEIGIHWTLNLCVVCMDQVWKSP